MSGSARGRAYCRGGLKRAVDLAAASAALLLLSPLFGIVAAAIVLTSGPPVFFRQVRVGLDGRPFRIFKFRTMRAGAPGLPITGRGDARITPIGRWLRGSKVDEFPQLLNVLAGQMSLVGPRPELPQYVALYTQEQRRVLEVRPGLTDDASVQFRDEERILGQVDPEGRERHYVAQILPRKLELNLGYIARAGFFCDLGILLRTARAVALRSRR